jgi:hypothetical protein
MAWTEELRQAFDDGGTKFVVARSLRKLMRPACKVGSLIFTECDLTKPFPEPRPISGIILRELTAEDVPLFPDAGPARDRFAAGHRSFGGIEERTGKLTNYRWVNASSAFIPELERYLIMGPKDVYVYDLNTLPEFRKRGIDACTRHFTYSYLRDCGYSRIYAYIHGDNHASLQASRRLLRRIGRVWYVQPRGCAPFILGGKGPGLPELRKQP